MVAELRPRIVIFGVGGAGGNAIKNMIESGLQGVEFIAANTDAQALSITGAEHKIQLGAKRTAGLGAGAHPEVGAEAAKESSDEIKKLLQGAHMCFIAAGMGGGTGTGAAPIIARIARELGVLTVGVVTKPFEFEGRRRMAIAEKGVSDLRPEVDTLIIIPNQNLIRIANEGTTFTSAFKMADEVLHAGVRSITDLMVMPGLINLDFADVRTVMAKMGTAMMGTGEAEGEGRAVTAAKAAIQNPLLDDVSMKGAQGVLINITGGDDLTLFEVDAAVNEVRREVDQDANVILGSTYDASLTGKVRVSVVAAGVTRSPASARPIEPLRAPASPAPVAIAAAPVTASAFAAAPGAPASPTEAGLDPRPGEAVKPAIVVKHRGEAAPVAEEDESLDEDDVLDAPANDVAPAAPQPAAAASLQAEEARGRPSLADLFDWSGKASEARPAATPSAQARKQEPLDEEFEIPAFLRRSGAG
ncbi:cell division protein FtsZ [bacterium]|nr:cell division protein FtsZ [bacterium]